MSTNFFSQLNALQVEGDFTITIKAGTHNRMLVSVLLANEKVGDTARKVIPPMILKGTIQELDEGFFNSISGPIQKTAALFVNMEAYAKAQEEAREQSKMEQNKEQQQKKAKEADTKKYDSQMKKVKELEEAGKFREAYAQLPKAADYPDQEEEIAEKKAALEEKFNQPSLF
jgi:PRTRC genetic system protein E